MRRTLTLLVVVGAALLAALLLLREGEEGGESATGDLAREEGAEERLPTLEGRPGPRTTQDEAPAGPGTVRGTVTRDGRPARAAVEVRRLRPTSFDTESLLWPPTGDGPALQATTSGEDGTFLVPGLELGSYEVTARAADGASARARAICRPARPAAEVRLRITRGEAALVGRAIYEEGRPFRGFVFPLLTNWVSPLHVPQVEVDGAGRFRIEGLFAGQVSIVFVAPGVLRSTFTAVGVPQLRERVFVVDGDLETWRGRVVADDTEEAVPAARLSYRTSSETSGRGYAARITADEAGGFELRAPVKPRRLWCLADGFEPLQYSIQEDEELVLRMRRRGRVAGRVVQRDGGQPVPGVEIHGWNWHTFGMQNPIAVSDAEGRFEAEAGPGKGMIYALGGGWISAGLVQAAEEGVNPLYVAAGPGEEAEVEVVVIPAGRARGRVLGADGSALAHQSVVLEQSGFGGFRAYLHHDGPFSAVSDARGRFVMSHVVPGVPFRLRVEPAEGLPGQSAEAVCASGETVEVDIVIPTPQWLPVRVVEVGTGRGVGGATVGARQGGHGANAMTAEDGTARLGPLLPEPLKLRANHPDYLSPTGHRFLGAGGLALDVPGSDPAEVVVELTPGFHVSGRILTPDGEPWTEGGGLAIHPVGTTNLKSLGLTGQVSLPDSAEFRLGPVPAGTYDLILVDGSFQDTSLVSRWTVEAGRQGLRLRVDPKQGEEAQRIVLRVRGAGGEDAHGWIGIASADGHTFDFGRLGKGEYVVTAHPAGTRVWIAIDGATDAEGKPLGALRKGPVVLVPGTTEIVLPAPRDIAGRVVDSDSKPVGGLVLRAQPVETEGAPPARSTFAFASLRTDADGTFTFHGLGAGPHRLLLEVPPGHALVEPPVVESGDDAVLISLRTGVEAVVRVLAADESPIEGATVTADLAAHLRGERTAKTDANGEARLRGLAAEQAYDLRVDPPAHRLDLADVWRGAWRPAPLDVVLPPGRVLQGTVRRGPSPLPWARIWWQDARGAWRQARADHQGAFRLRVPVGSLVTLRLEAPAGEARDAPPQGVVVEPDEDDVVLRSP